jgi:Mg2+-importing ATPase
MTNKNEWNEWKGLTEAEAAERRVRYGPNALPVPKHRLLGLIAAGVTFSLGEPIDGAFILLFVFLGTALTQRLSGAQLR